MDIAEKRPLTVLRTALALLLASVCLVAATLLGANKAWAEDAGQTLYQAMYQKGNEYTLLIQTTPTEKETAYGSLLEQRQQEWMNGWDLYNHCLRDFKVKEPNHIVFRGGVKAPLSMEGFFGVGKNTLKSIDLRGLDTSEVISMRALFYLCSGLTSIDLSPLDTSKVTDMSWMFQGCSGLTSIDVSPLDTSHVKWPTGMFSDCTGLRYLDLSPFDLSRMDDDEKDMSVLIGGCENLQALALRVGTKLKDSVSICPFDALSTYFTTCESSNNSVVSISGDRGRSLTALKEGLARLTFSDCVQKPSVTGYLNITVKKPGAPWDPTAIAPASKPSLANATVTVKTRVWSGKKLTPSVTVKLNGKTLKAGTDYTVTWTSADKSKTAKKAGRYAVTVKGKGAYVGSQKAWFEVTPAAPTKAKAAAAGKKRVKVTWAKPSKKMAAQVSGWQVQVATDKKFTKSVKSVTAKKSAASATVSKLKKGKAYYVHVRAWAKAGSAKVYGPWSKTVKVKVK